MRPHLLKTEEPQQKHRLTLGMAWAALKRVSKPRVASRSSNSGVELEVGRFMSRRAEKKPAWAEAEQYKGPGSGTNGFNPS